MLIKIEEPLRAKLPDLILGGFVTDVKVAAANDQLQSLMDKEVEVLAAQYTPALIRELSPVKANKNAYRTLGKDPNRYRPAAESLLRRVAGGKGLYRINNVVDILNITSLKTGFSICGYNYDAIEGDVSMGIGEANEAYEGIGRGDLNIERLPVFRDALGAFGNPTSDSTRTMVSDVTSKFLMIVIGFDGKDAINDALDDTLHLLQKYAEGKEIERFFVE
ncbi:MULTISPECIES: B3/B4 domain-containing protein [unclassified Carboxylicivirga]|uniref:B3/B4 domain-containing protein n=1 Tax=Carboxylicivirga TaxID=1628153 RepID=UPI003D3274ED